jgi:hypothetical protein
MQWSARLSSAISPAWQTFGRTYVIDLIGAIATEQAQSFQAPLRYEFATVMNNSFPRRRLELRFRIAVFL